jgi:hypothetical protein
MPVKQESLNRDLYGILKSRGYRPDMYTSAGKKVAIPDEAEVFQFDFVKDGKNYGKVTATIDGLHRLIIYYGDDVAKSPKADTTHEGMSSSGESFTHLLKHLKRFAKNKQLGFELSDQDDLEPDMAKREHIKSEGLNEGYYPMSKTKSYSDNVPSTKIILQHSRQIEEGEQRYRNIAKIFVENLNGERFLLPTNKPGLARVYARHIAEGGTPYDERGQHITSLCEEYNKMAGFVRATKNKQFNESAQNLINEGINHYNNLRETLHKLAGKRGYSQYFESYTPALMEEEGADLSEMFMQSSLDPRIESVMPILGKLSKNISETTDILEVTELEEWADLISETSLESNEVSDDTKQKPSDQNPWQGVNPRVEKPLRPDGSIEAKSYYRAPKKEPVQKRPITSFGKKPMDEEDELIAGRYTQDEWDKMVERVKKLAHKQEAEKKAKQDKSKESEQKTNEAGPPGTPGDYLDAQDTVSTGKILGNTPQTQHGLRGKLVGESDDPLLKIKKLSGL